MKGGVIVTHQAKALEYPFKLHENLNDSSLKKCKKVLLECSNLFIKKLRKRIRKFIKESKTKLELQSIQANMISYYHNVQLGIIK